MDGLNSSAIRKAVAVFFFAAVWQILSLPGWAADETLVIIPENPPAGWSSQRYITLALTYKNMGEPEKAKATLGLAIKAAKNNTDKNRALTMLKSELPRYTVSNDANKLNNQGYTQMAQNHHSQAIVIFKQCAAKYPKYESPLNSLSTIYLVQKKPILAREAAKKALAINPDSSNAWLNLGNSYLLESDYKSARTYAEKAVKCYPENFNAVEMLKYIKAKGH